MSWSIGFDEHWQRDVGYGVPCVCDNPGCDAQIDRGLSYVCGDDIKGGEYGCGLYFCEKHKFFHIFRDGHCCCVCKRCHTYRKPFKPKPDVPEWIHHKATDPSWEEWRKEQAQST
jgi:hypothetical protein